MESVSILIIDATSGFPADEHLVLRPPRPEDGEAHVRAVSETQPQIGRWMPWAAEGYRLSDFEFWRTNNHGYELLITDPIDDEIIGSCGLNNFDRENHRANLGYWIRASQQGKGYATRATLMLARYGFTRLALSRIEIIVDAVNEASLAVARRVGAYEEGLQRNRLRNLEGPANAIMFSLIPNDLEG